MQLFKKREKTEKDEKPQKKKFKNSAKWKHGGYSLGIIAAAIAGVIVLNVLMSVLSSRVTLKFDLSSTGQNTISEENLEFIKSIDKEVTVTVCALRDEYEGGEMTNLAMQYLNVYDSTGSYYSQTLRLIDSYAENNPNIKVEYIDYFGTAGQAIANEHPSVFFGDIVVSYTDADGESKSRLISYDDIYSYSDTSGAASYGYDYYYIDGNNIETVLTSAINGVINGESKNIGFLKNRSDSEIFSSLFEGQLEYNNFNITEITDNIITEIPEDIDTLLIVAPTADYLPDELNVINEWLDNDGLRGHSVLFFPSASVANIPNLLEFLEEWGIKYTDGILYETDSSNRSSADPTAMVVFDNETRLTGVIPESGTGSIVGRNVPMMPAYESYSSRSTNVLVSTQDTVVAAPIGIDDNWKPSADYVKQSYSNLIITADNNAVDSINYTSYVAAFSSYEFIYSTWAQYSQLENMELAVNTAVKIAGFENTTNKTFITKVITTESFADQVTESGANIIQVVFVILLPLALIAAGVVVFIRRRIR